MVFSEAAVLFLFLSRALLLFLNGEPELAPYFGNPSSTSK